MEFWDYDQTAPYLRTHFGVELTDLVVTRAGKLIFGGCPDHKPAGMGFRARIRVDGEHLMSVATDGTVRSRVAKGMAQYLFRLPVGGWLVWPVTGWGSVLRRLGGIDRRDRDELKPVVERLLKHLPVGREWTFQALVLQDDEDDFLVGLISLLLRESEDLYMYPLNGGFTVYGCFHERAMRIYSKDQSLFEGDEETLRQSHLVIGYQTRSST
jgi:hypothetical protein